MPWNLFSISRAYLLLSLFSNHPNICGQYLHNTILIRRSAGGPWNISTLSARVEALSMGGEQWADIWLQNTCHKNNRNKLVMCYDKVVLMTYKCVRETFPRHMFASFLILNPHMIFYFLFSFQCNRWTMKKWKNEQTWNKTFR